MTKIKLNNNTEIDLQKLIEGKLLVQANSGGGKSWLLRRLLEQSHGKVQQIVLDPEGEFASLREKYDYILAGKEGDTPADPRSAALLARRLLELNVSAIIDLYELHPQDRKRFVRLFLEAMINSPKELHHPCLIVLDEAHMFAPEKGQSEALDAVISLASLGRKRGFSAVLATQRISKLHKDAAAECNNKLIGRTGLDIDRKRASEELGFTSKEQVLSLRTLEPGEFYAFGPAISNEVISVKVGDVQTTHPKAGSRFKERTVPPTAKIKALLPKLSDLPAEAKKEALTISELQTEIRNLKRDNGQLVRDSKLTKIDPKEYTRNSEVAKMILHATEKATREATAAERDFVLQELELAFKPLMYLKKWVVDNKLENKSARVKHDTYPSIIKIRTVGITDHQIPAFRPANDKLQIMDDVEKDNTDFRISSSQQRILNALKWAESLNISPTDKTQVALLADASPSSGGYFNNLGALRTAGLISYPSPGTIALTDAGRDQAQDSGIPSSTEELHEQLFRKLSLSQSAILKVLIEIYPDPISKVELAERAGASSTSGGYFNNLGRLRSLKLIDYPSSGMVVAEKVLFL